MKYHVFKYKGYEEYPQCIVIAISKSKRNFVYRNTMGNRNFGYLKEDTYIPRKTYLGLVNYSHYSHQIFSESDFILDLI